MVMTQQACMRRSSLELATVSAPCYADPGAPYSSSFDQDPALSLLLAASAQQNGYAAPAQQNVCTAPAHQNGYAAPAHQNGFAASPAGLGLQAVSKPDPMLLAAAGGNSGVVGGSNGNGFYGDANGMMDASMLMDVEEPGPLPCLPRAGRTLGSAGPFNSSAQALLGQQPQAGMRGAPRPRRHSVTIGMPYEQQQQQQQQAAAYAAALAAQQGSAMGLQSAAVAASINGLLGGLNGLPQLQQQQHAAGAVASPAKQQLHALSNMQAAALAAQMGLAGGALGTFQHAQPQPSVSPLEALQQQQQQQQRRPLNGSSHGAPGISLGGLQDFSALTDCSVPFNMNAPRMPNAGSCRRHSWAPTSMTGPSAYALLLQQQQRQQQLAAINGDTRGLMGYSNGTAFGHKPQNGYAGSAPGAYTNRAALLSGIGPSSGSYGGLSAAAQLTSPHNGGLAAGYDPAAAERLLLQQASNLAAGQRELLEALLDSVQVSQGLVAPQQSTTANGMLSNLAAAAAGSPFGPGLLPAAAAAGTQLSALGFDADGLGGAAAPANMYAPLKVNGVTLDSQLLVSPFADNWDMSGSQGVPGLTPQQLAAAASAAGGGVGPQQYNGYKSSAPTRTLAAAAAAGGHGAVAVGANGNGHSKAHKGMPARSGSSSSSSSNGSSATGLNGSGTGSAKAGGAVLVVAAAGAAAAASAAGGMPAASRSSSAAAAALEAAASMLASLPPQSKVCSDVPWDLTMAAEEDAKVLSAQQQQVQQLMDVMKRSRTLQRAAQAAALPEAACAGEAADAAASKGGSGSGRGAPVQPVLFGYQLPDTGADAWGDSSSAAVESTPGSACISQEPSNKLFVGNIGWWVTEEDLLHWFSRFGTVVTVKIMYNSRKMHKPKDKWRSREYGFIDYATPEEAAKAIVWMDGVELPDLMKDTCGIIVQYAKPTSGNGGNGNGNGGQQGHDGGDADGAR